MNILDFLILLPIAFFGYRGFKNGLVQEVLGIVGIILGVFLSFQYMHSVGEHLRPYLTEYETYIPFIAALLIFISTLVVVNIIAYVASKLLEAIQLSFINRITGLSFGALKSGIAISALLLVAAGFNMPSQDVREQSVSYSYVIYLAPWAYDTVASVYPGAEDFVETVRKTIDEHNPIQNFPFLEQ